MSAVVTDKQPGNSTPVNGHPKPAPRGRPFPKGTSGNPAGRPKGASALAQRMRGRLEQPASVAEWSKSRAVKLGLDPERVTIADVLVDASLAAAIDGEGGAFRETWDRVEGKVPDRHAGHDGEELTLKILSGVSMNDL